MGGFLLQRNKMLQAPNYLRLVLMAWAEQTTCPTVGAFLLSWLYLCMLAELAVTHPWLGHTLTVQDGLRAPATRCWVVSYPSLQLLAGPQCLSARSLTPLPAAESSFCCFKHLFPISKIRLVRKISLGCLNFYQGLQKRGGEGGEAEGFPNQDRLLQSKTLFKGKRERGRERRGEKTSLLENTGAAVCALGFFSPPPSLASVQSSYYWPRPQQINGVGEGGVNGGVCSQPPPPAHPLVPLGGGNPALTLCPAAAPGQRKLQRERF